MTSYLVAALLRGVRSFVRFVRPDIDARASAEVARLVRNHDVLCSKLTEQSVGVKRIVEDVLGPIADTDPVRLCRHLTLRICSDADQLTALREQVEALERLLRERVGERDANDLLELRGYLVEAARELRVGRVGMPEVELAERIRDAVYGRFSELRSLAGEVEDLSTTLGRIAALVPRWREQSGTIGFSVAARCAVELDAALTEAGRVRASESSSEDDDETLQDAGWEGRVIPRCRNCASYVQSDGSSGLCTVLSASLTTAADADPCRRWQPAQGTAKHLSGSGAPAMPDVRESALDALTEQYHTGISSDTDHRAQVGLMHDDSNESAKQAQSRRAGRRECHSCANEGSSSRTTRLKEENK